MKPHLSMPIKLLVTAALLMFVSRCAVAEVLDKTKNIAGTTVHYKVVLPNGFDPGKAYPGVLAFPGGAQDMDTVEGTVERHWRAEAQRRGYIVVVPAAPDGVLFF